MKLFLSTAILLFALFSAYWVGLASAEAGDCYDISDQRQGCEGSGNTSLCAACSQGSCSGTAKIAGVSFTLVGGLAEGKKDVFQLMERCWRSYSCIPVGGGECNALNPCLPEGAYSRQSMNFFATFILSGDCPEGGLN